MLQPPAIFPPVERGVTPSATEVDETIVCWEVKLEVVNFIGCCVNFETEISGLLYNESGVGDGEDEVQKASLEGRKRLVVFPWLEEGGGDVVLGGNAGNCGGGAFGKQTMG